MINNFSINDFENYSQNLVPNISYSSTASVINPPKSPNFYHSGRSYWNAFQIVFPTLAHNFNNLHSPLSFLPTIPLPSYVNFDYIQKAQQMYDFSLFSISLGNSVQYTINYKQKECLYSALIYLWNLPPDEAYFCQSKQIKLSPRKATIKSYPLFWSWKIMDRIQFQRFIQKKFGTMLYTNENDRSVIIFGQHESICSIVASLCLNIKTFYHRSHEPYYMITLQSNKQFSFPSQSPFPKMKIINMQRNGLKFSFLDESIEKSICYLLSGIGETIKPFIIQIQQERLEKERLEKERLEKERLEKERLNQSTNEIFVFTKDMKISSDLYNPFLNIYNWTSKESKGKLILIPPQNEELSQTKIDFFKTGLTNCNNVGINSVFTYQIHNQAYFIPLLSFQFQDEIWVMIKCDEEFKTTHWVILAAVESSNTLPNWAQAFHDKLGIEIYFGKNEKYKSYGIMMKSKIRDNIIKGLDFLSFTYIKEEILSPHYQLISKIYHKSLILTNSIIFFYNYKEMDIIEKAKDIILESEFYGIYYEKIRYSNYYYYLVSEKFPDLDEKQLSKDFSEKYPNYEFSILEIQEQKIYKIFSREGIIREDMIKYFKGFERIEFSLKNVCEDILKRKKYLNQMKIIVPNIEFNEENLNYTILRNQAQYLELLKSNTEFYKNLTIIKKLKLNKLFDEEEPSILFSFIDIPLITKEFERKAMEIYGHLLRGISQTSIFGVSEFSIYPYRISNLDIGRSIIFIKNLMNWKQEENGKFYCLGDMAIFKDYTEGLSSLFKNRIFFNENDELVIDNIESNPSKQSEIAISLLSFFNCEKEEKNRLIFHFHFDSSIIDKCEKAFNKWRETLDSNKRNKISCCQKETRIIIEYSCPKITIKDLLNFINKYSSLIEEDKGQEEKSSPQILPNWIKECILKCSNPPPNLNSINVTDSDFPFWQNDNEIIIYTKNELGFSVVLQNALEICFSIKIERKKEEILQDSTHKEILLYITIISRKNPRIPFDYITYTSNIISFVVTPKFIKSRQQKFNCIHEEIIRKYEKLFPEFKIEYKETSKRLTMKFKEENIKIIKAEIIIINIFELEERNEGRKSLFEKIKLFLEKEKERLEREKEEQERLKREKEEQERLEKERLKQERLEKERLKQERLQKEKEEQERLQKEKEEQERLEKERLEQERLKQEILKNGQIFKINIPPTLEMLKKENDHFIFFAGIDCCYVFCSKNDIEYVISLLRHKE